MSKFFQKKSYNSSDSVGKMYIVNRKHLDPKIIIMFTVKSPEAKDGFIHVIWHLMVVILVCVCAGGGGYSTLIFI